MLGRHPFGSSLNRLQVVNKGWLGREPLLWFVLIGALLFWLDARYNNADQAIIINEIQVKRLASLWQKQMQRPPSEAELESLINNWVDEETFYREALRLRLDEADTIIRRRLLQKYQFLLEEVAESELTEAAVEAYYRTNINAYMKPERTSYDHILLAEGSKQAQQVRSELAAGKDFRTLGADSLLESSYQAQSVKEIIFTMGPGFLNQLERALVGVWQGPIRSSYGRHLVRIVRIDPPAPKPLTSIIEKVRYDLTRALGDKKKADELERLRQYYPVIDDRP